MIYRYFTIAPVNRQIVELINLTTKRTKLMSLIKQAEVVKKRLLRNSNGKPSNVGLRPHPDSTIECAFPKDCAITDFCRNAKACEGLCGRYSSIIIF